MEIKSRRLSHRVTGSHAENSLSLIRYNLMSHDYRHHKAFICLSKRNKKYIAVVNKIRINVLANPNSRIYKENLQECQDGFTELSQKTNTTCRNVATMSRMATGHKYYHETVS